MKILIVPFSICYLSLMFGITSFKSEEIRGDVENQVRQTALKDFSKTKLFKGDSVFDVTLYDTLRRMELKRIDKHNAEWIRGKMYANLIAVAFGAYRNKIFVDTTVSVLNQAGIPSRCIEMNGKLFFWYDAHYPLTSNTIRELDKYRVLSRGGSNDPKQYDVKTDDSLRGIDYYFCRNDLSVYKRVITSKAIGYYDPPNITCK